MKNVLYILGGAGLLYVLGKLSLGKRIVVNLTGAKVKGRAIDPTIEIFLTAQNPTRQTAVLNSISGTIFLDGNQISNISSFKMQQIQPMAETQISFDVKPGLVGSLNILRELFTRTNFKTFKFRFAGSVNVDNVVIPIDNEIVI